MASVRYLLDTNVISELRKRRRSEAVERWVGQLPADGAFVSVITVGEIAKGIAKRRTSAEAREADELQTWLDGLLALYAERVLAIDVPIAARWGRLCNDHPELATDMLLAATALEHGLTVATRNVAHFRVAGVPTVNPFTG
ncbi:MAG TPA: type II toxin-antitoxin system VapC family toxin [Gemmatimonadaceae bacterium]|nr:type II toxin-antitoxin system VapC family toxin [Gemmatimonadaceae bacterium]